MKLKDKKIMSWVDTQLKRMEQEADRIGYPLDDDLTNQEICKTLAEIEWEDIIPDTQTWVGIAYLMGIVQQRINQKAEIGQPPIFCRRVDHTPYTRPQK